MLNRIAILLVTLALALVAAPAQADGDNGAQYRTTCDGLETRLTYGGGDGGDQLVGGWRLVEPISKVERAERGCYDRAPDAVLTKYRLRCAGHQARVVHVWAFKADLDRFRSPWRTFKPLTLKERRRLGC